MKSPFSAPRGIGSGCAAGLLTILAACSGSDGGGGDGSAIAASCAEPARKQFVLDSVDSWYLFPDLLPETVNPGDFETAEELLDHLTATAREQGKDRNFSYLTTRQEDDALLDDGRYPGFGFRRRIDSDDRIFIVDVFEFSPAAEARLGRGDEIVAIDSGDGFVAVADLLSEDTLPGDLFGDREEGVSRGLRVRRGTDVLEVELTKRLIAIDPIPDDQGIRILPLQGTTGVGYLNLRAYSATAAAELSDAFEGFRSQNIDYYIVDLRYNGGGLVNVAELMNNLLGGGRSRSDLQFRYIFNPKRSSEDTAVFFDPLRESVRPVRITFLTTDVTLSASELNIISMNPWVEAAIIGGNTGGKPVGQIALDLNGCDDRLRLIAFKFENAAEDGEYFEGLADRMRFACASEDALDYLPGDPQEAMTSAALEWLNNGACTRPMEPTSGAPAKPTIERYRSRGRSQRSDPIEQWLPGAD